MKYAAVTEQLAGLGSDKWALSIAASARIAAGQPVINLTIGEPDVGTPQDLIKLGRLGGLGGGLDQLVIDGVGRALRRGEDHRRRHVG